MRPRGVSFGSGFLPREGSCFLVFFGFFEAVVSNVKEKVFTPEGAVDSLLSIGNSLRKLVSKLNNISLLFLSFPSFSEILDRCDRKSFFFLSFF